MKLEFVVSRKRQTYGFATVDEPMLMFLEFSCRIQNQLKHFFAVHINVQNLNISAADSNQSAAVESKMRRQLGTEYEFYDFLRQRLIAQTRGMQ